MRARRCRWSLSRWQSTFVVGAIHLRHSVSPSLSQSLSHLSPSITSANLSQLLQNANRTSRLVDSLHKAAKGFRKESLTYFGQALYNLFDRHGRSSCWDEAITLLHQCLERFCPLACDCFRFRLEGQCVGNYEAEDLAPEMKLLIQLWLTPVIIGAGLVILIAQYTKQSSTAKDQLVNKRGYCEKKRKKICQREEIRGLKMIITRYSASVVLASLPLDDNEWLSFMGSRSSIHDKTLNFLHLGRGKT